MTGRGIKGQSPEFAERTKQMASMYQSGLSLEQIGQTFGVTRERVRQCISKFAGLTRKDGGSYLRGLASKARRDAVREVRYMKKFGCTSQVYKTIPEKAKRAYHEQRMNARWRNIGWGFNLFGWWTFWQQSGKWEQRGRGKGYMMCRFGDVGGYEVGNVYIATGVHNGTVQINNPYRVDHPRHDEVFYVLRQNGKKGGSRETVHKRKYTDLPRGVTFHKGSGSYIAQIGINGKNNYLGSFKSPDLAHAAYLAAIPAHEAAA